MAIKFNHVTNTISFTSSGCSSSFVDSSATGVFETTGYARNCYVTTGQTGSFEYIRCPSSPSAGCVICYDGANWVAGTSAGGGGGGTTLPNGSSTNSALCWNGSAWTTGQSYVATGQTGNFSAHNFDFNNFNVTYKCNSNLVLNSTGSAILQGSGNCIESSLYSQINNGCNNLIRSVCHNYIENGLSNCIISNSSFSEILNGTGNIITGSAVLSAIVNGSANTIRGGTGMAIVSSLSSNIFGAGVFASSILGGCTHTICSASRSSIIGGQGNGICLSSTDGVINGGRGNAICNGNASVIVGGICSRMLHSAAQTGNIIIGGECSRISGLNTNYNTIVNSFGSILCASCNTLINGTNSCLISGASSSLIIGPCNIVCGYNTAVVIGSGITANANNTLFTNNLCVLGSIAGTGGFETTGYARNCYVKCPSSPAAGCVICYDGTNWVAGTSAGGGGGTTLPNGTSANSALCWNGTAWVAAQTYVATGQTGVYETTGYARNCYVNTGQTGVYETTGYARRCFVTTGQTGVYETTGYARNCYVTTGQTGVYETTGYARNCYVTTGQTGSFTYVRCPSSPAVNCVICYDGTNWIAGTVNVGGLPNGTSANSALCWNGTAWVAAQTYVATGQTGVYETTGYARNCYVNTGQTGVYETTGYARRCFVTTGQTGVYETTGYARRCFITTGQTGNFVLTSQTGNFISTGLGYLNINSVFESITICNTGSSGVININIIDGSSVYNILNSTAKWALNLRGNASCSLNSLLPINKTATISFLNTNGIVPYELTGVSIDGTTQTVRWMNGTGGFPTGSASLIDMYSITTIKTGNNLYTVFGSTSYLKS